METTSVVIVTHQSAAFIGRVLDAVATDPEGPSEVIVVDSGSTDDTRSIVSSYDVRAIHVADNVGFVAGCHIGAQAATGTVVVFLGHDTEPEPGWLTPLVAAVRRADVGAAMSTIVDADRPDTFNTSGGHLNYVGLAWLSGLGDRVPLVEPELVDVAFPSGAAMAMRSEVWQRFDGFRRSLFMYHEDSDLGWRLRLAGLRVVRATTSRVRHTYDFSRTPSKMFHLERNRWVMLGTNYRPSTLAVLAPALLMAEAGIWVVSIRDGWAIQKLRAAVDAVRSRNSWRADRGLVERNRVVGDAVMLRTMDTAVGSVRQISVPRGTSVVDGLLAGYLRLALPLIGMLDRRR